MPKRIQRLKVVPTLTLDQAEKEFAGLRLGDDHYDQLVTDNLLGVLPSGEIKFLFLRDVLLPDAPQQVWEHLRPLPFGQGQRMYSFQQQGSSGGGLVMGWLPERRGSRVTLTKASRWNPVVYGFLLPQLAGAASYELKTYLPKIWHEQKARAKKNGHRVIASGIYSTAQLNKNLRFPAHADARNERGSLAALMAFGPFGGGALVLPRLRVAFQLRPGDLLLADTNRELHGNLPIYGERIAVIFFLKDLRDRKAGKPALPYKTVEA